MSRGAFNDYFSKTRNELQDSFLNHVRKENLGVIIYLMNGFQIRGLVRGFDNFTVIIENEGKQQLVYKHAISTISPQTTLLLCSLRKKNFNKVMIIKKNGAQALFFFF